MCSAKIGIPVEEADIDDELEDLLHEVLQQQTTPPLYAPTLSSRLLLPFRFLLKLQPTDEPSATMV